VVVVLGYTVTVPEVSPALKPKNAVLFAQLVGLPLISVPGTHWVPTEPYELMWQASRGMSPIRQE
jgi:hypothetical protein